MRLDQAVRFEIQFFLKSVLEESGDYIAYKDGWTDKLVGEKFNVPRTIIAGTRLATFGKLQERGGSSEEVSLLTERVTRLEDQNLEIKREQLEMRGSNVRLLDHMETLSQLVKGQKTNGEDHHAS